MTHRILCVDDEPNLLNGIKRQLRNQFDLDIAVGPHAALDMINRNGPYAVVVTDMRMPEMSGVQLLMEIQRISCDTVRLMLTGNSDLQTAVEAVNQGHVFRFLSKPCSQETLAAAMQAGLEQYRLVTSEKVLLTKTLAGSMSLLTDVLSLVHPGTAEKATRLRQLARQIVCHLPDAIGWEIEIAALASQIGCVAVPQAVMAKSQRGEKLTAEESKIYRSHPQVGGRLLSRIPRLENVARIVTLQQARCRNSDQLSVDAPSEDSLPLGARVLKVCLDYDLLTSSGMENSAAVRELYERDGSYDLRVLAALSVSLGQTDEVVDLSVVDLAEEMTVVDNVVSADGDVLLAHGQRITSVVRERLLNYSTSGRGVREPIRVRRPIEVASDRVQSEEPARPA